MSSNSLGSINNEDVFHIKGEFFLFISVHHLRNSGNVFRIQRSSCCPIKFRILKRIQTFIFLIIVLFVHFQLLIGLLFIPFHKSNHLFVQSFQIRKCFLHGVLRLRRKDHEKSRQSRCRSRALEKWFEIRF